MEKLKIGMFMDSWYPDINGVILVMENLIKNMSDYADVTLVVPKMGDEEYDDKKYPFRIIRVDSVPLVLADYKVGLVDLEYFKLKKIFKNIDLDIVHIHSPFFLGRLGIRVAREKNIPVVATFHTRWEFEFEKYLKNKKLAKLCVKHVIKTYNKCDSSIMLNAPLVDIFRRLGYKGKSVIIGNGTDLKIVKNKRKSLERVNDLFKLDKDDNVLLFVGRINSVKNIYLILDVLKELKKRDFNFKMLFVGDGPDYDNFKKRIAKYRLTNEVIMTGRIYDRELLKDIYYRSNLFIFPSLFDTSSLVQKEAASQETPTLFVEGSVTSNEADDNVTGFIEKEDVDLFANRIIEIFGNKRLFNKVKKNARKQLAKPWKEISKATYNFYLDTIDEYRRGEKYERRRKR